jgi:hydrogenase expression/formation protein HypE
VTGDTKVLPRGTVDGLLINTSGLGELFFPMPGPNGIEVEDAILVSGPIARHGIAVLAARESLGFDPPPESDCGNLFPAMLALREAGIPVRAARDATRGGVAAVLHEWADVCGHSIAIDEKAVPLTGDVRGACELLGLDPLHVACEGTMVLAVPADQSAAAIEMLRTVPISASAMQIGQVIPRTAAPVLVNRALRRLVPLDEPSGAPMPRIC